jgi:hypothetical protein
MTKEIKPFQRERKTKKIKTPHSASIVFRLTIIGGVITSGVFLYMILLGWGI